MLKSPEIADDLDRVTARIKFVGDLEAQLVGRVLRSLSPHAKVAHVDASLARSVPGVAAVITGHELAERKDLRCYYGPVVPDQPILAIDRVRYVGEPVAAVAANDADAAEEAIDKIVVEYEGLPAIFDEMEAIADGAPLVHPDLDESGHHIDDDIILRRDPRRNICNQFRLRKGDVEEAFQHSDHVFEHVFKNPPVQPAPLEAHVCIAEVTPGNAIVWTANQLPSALRNQIANILRLPASRVRIIVPTIGGGYGGKAYATVEPIAVILAQLSRKRVKVQLRPDEEFLTVSKHGATIRLTTAIDDDARIVGRRSLAYFNTGAYADIGPRLIQNSGFSMMGPYEVPNASVDSFAIYTNLPPAGALRGFGVDHAAWAYETQMDIIAHELGLDPFKFRLRNLLTDGSAAATGERVHGVAFGQLLSSAAQRIGWGNRAAARDHQGARQRVKGKGIACIIKGTVTPSTSTVILKLNDDGSLDVLSSSVEMGQGVRRSLVVLASEALGVPQDRVNVAEVDTAVTPYDMMTGSSRSTFSMGKAIGLAAAEVREQLISCAADILEASPRDLELSQGNVAVIGTPTACLDYGTVVTRSQSGNIIGRGTFTTQGGLDPDTGQGVASVHWHQAVGAAEVEVDVQTGKITLIACHVGAYAGRVVNRIQAELQLEGNVAFGVGQALFEERIFDNGELLNANLADYVVPSFLDFPSELSLDLLVQPGADIHGLGESTLPPVMPAIGNAVFNAVGVRILDLPLTPERVLRSQRSGTAWPQSSSHCNTR